MATSAPRHAPTRDAMPLSFAPHLDVLTVDDRGLAMIGEQGCDVFGGPAFAKLGALIDGTRTEADVLAALDEQEREEVGAALTQLRRAGALIERSNGALPDREAAWWSSQLIAPGTAEAKIRESAVRVQALGGVDPAPTIEALSGAGIRLDDDAGLTLVLVDDYLDPDLAEINRAALSEDRRWMLAQPGAAMTLIGPVFFPDRGPCWECLAERLQHKRGVEQRVRWVAGRPGEPARIEAPAVQQRLGPTLIATEFLRFVVGARPDFDSIVLTFDGRTLESRRHKVPWRPQCEACGAGEEPPENGATPVRVRRPGEGESSEKGLRSIAPQVTLQRFEHHVSTLTGAVHALNRAHGPEYLHAYMAGGPMPRIHGDRSGWQMLEDMMSGGKGTTDQAARASALCEALERYSGGFFGSEPRHRALIEELGDAAIAPNDYMRFSARQFAERERWNERAGSFRTRVPEPFDPSLPIDWSPLWSLTHERERWLPTGLCYYGANVLGAPFCIPESNGNAAGNTIEEAILHGLLELVERDHVALWWYNRIPAPGVDLDSIDEPWLAQLREHVRAQDRELWALDLTADLGIPAAAALVASADGSGVGMGLGAHMDLRGAVVRAATELAQLGLGSPSGGLGSGAHPALHLDEHGFARPDPNVPARSCAEVPQFSGDVVDALEQCRSAMERQGLEVLVLDQTRPDIGLPVAKAVVPGMRHFWPRFGPGRLYDVPVALGRLSEPRLEEELNPTPPVP